MRLSMNVLKNVNLFLFCHYSQFFSFRAEEKDTVSYFKLFAISSKVSFPCLRLPDSFWIDTSLYIIFQLENAFTFHRFGQQNDRLGLLQQSRVECVSLISLQDRNQYRMAKTSSPLILTNEINRSPCNSFDLAQFSSEDDMFFQRERERGEREYFLEWQGLSIR